MNRRTGLIERGRNWLGSQLMKNELARAKQAEAMFLDMYKWGPGVIDPETVINNFKEIGFDTQLFHLMQDQLANWDIIGGDVTQSEQVRLRLVDKSRQLARFDSVVGHIEKLWTDFGFGINVDVSPRKDNEEAVKTWNAFWEAPANQVLLSQRKLQMLSQKLLGDGELYIIFFVNKVDGTVIIRLIPTEEIVKVVTQPDDKLVVAYWKRQWIKNDEKGTEEVQYYRDWLAEANGIVDEKGQIKSAPVAGNTSVVELPPNAKVADQQNENTDVFVMQLARDEDNNHRGWPLLTAGFSWANVYSDFAKDRAAVAKSVAMFVDKVKAKTGQRGLDQLKARIGTTVGNPGSFGVETNPAAARGSTWLENEAATRTRMPLNTGGGDAQKDGAILINQLTLAARIFPHWAGYGDSYRLATATSMELPMLKAFSRYQAFWASVWTDIATIVFTVHNKFNKSAPEITDITVDVNLDTIIDTEIENIFMAMDKTIEMFENGFLDDEQASEVLIQLLKNSLQVVGIKNTADLMSFRGVSVQTGDNDDEDDDENEEATMRAFEEFMKELIELLPGEVVIKEKYKKELIKLGLELSKSES